MVSEAEDRAAGEHALARHRMVQGQLVRRGIRDSRVLDAMGSVPREAFVPTFLQPFAYDDRPLLIGYEQTISQPCIVASMSETLGLKGKERVLEIGTGSGYQTAILAELCAEVFTIERIESLSVRAKSVLKKLGYKNVHYRVGDGALGWPEEAPFDAILVAAGAARLPTAYHSQIVEGGRLVIPLGPQGDQVLHSLTRRGDGWDDQELGRVAFVPLVSEK